MKVMPITSKTFPASFANLVIFAARMFCRPCSMKIKNVVETLL